MLHMHQVEGAIPSALTICPCGVVQSTRLPLMQEITGAKPVRDPIFHRRVVRGEQQTHLTQNQAALEVQVLSRPPFRCRVV